MDAVPERWHGLGTSTEALTLRDHAEGHQCSLAEDETGIRGYQWSGLPAAGKTSARD